MATPFIPAQKTRVMFCSAKWLYRSQQPLKHLILIPSNNYRRTKTYTAIRIITTKQRSVHILTTFI